MSTPTRKLHVPLLAKLASTPSINPSLPPPIFPPPPPPSSPPQHIASFKPSVAVIVAALTTMFSLTFLLLLYAKHCKRENGNAYSRGRGSRVPPLSANRRNSGVDRTVIDLLPVFRFGALQGEKDGLECAVCLNRFEPAEVLRLLPKCKHAFHVECVDTWLDAHSTCPLCRYRVDPEDILLVGDAVSGVLGRREPPPPHEAAGVDSIKRLESSRRISGRHSSAGERGTGLLKIFLHRPSQDSNSVNRQRRSLDSWSAAARKKSKKIPESANVNVGCFERQQQQRKDGLLLTGRRSVELENERRRLLEHRIIIGGGGRKEWDGGLPRQRWSEVQGSDLMLLRTEMIMNENRRWSSSSSSSGSMVQNWKWNRKGNSNSNNSNSNGGRRETGIEEDGRNVIKGRTVSEITQ